MKLAGAGGGGTIIALSYEPERTNEALLAAGAECFLELQGSMVGKIES